MLGRIKHLKIFAGDPDKKPLFKIIKECLHFGLLKKDLPVDYFRKFLYRTDVKNYQDYLSLKEHYGIIESPKMVFPEVSQILQNKLSFKLICINENLPVPKLISYNLKGWFLFNKKNKYIENKKDLLFFYKHLFDHLQINKIFIKPIDGIGGFGCILLKKESLETELNIFGDKLLNNSYLHEEYIEQHDQINKIHPHAVNTLRMVHYIDRNQNVHILSTFMRFGVGKSIIDNTSNGGFSIGVNNESGILEGIGRQEVSKGGATFLVHPDTQYKLNGFKIPFYEEACALVKDFAFYFPNRIVGWDIAITNSGPVIIEGNHNPGLHVSDINYGGYMKHPLIKEILNEINQ
ncbi:sugar-transfer associated ATP-grasp domain-containing protein [Mariniflexile aquimaris]|uniref:Sugar-transfer associated ATP-grasp domain-containing protein n=1 Tax=Mariniflexile aquimaris TaxID=881009 RepID=A0ABW3BUF6_9FLAO